MRIQGWGSRAAPASGAVTVHPISDINKRNSTSPADTSTRSCYPEPSRKELLDAIKNRIKSGFYNSEVVIDNLGHEFAQVLDRTL